MSQKETQDITTIRLDGTYTYNEKIKMVHKNEVENGVSMSLALHYKNFGLCLFLYYGSGPGQIHTIFFISLRFASKRNKGTPYSASLPTVNSPAVSVLYRKDTAYDFFLDIFLSVNTIIIQRECDEN